MYRIITEETVAGDKAVTSHYLKIIYEAIIKAGKECAFGWIDGAPKSDTLIFDECKVALKYRLRGYRNTVVWVQGIVPEEAIMKGYSRWRYYAHSIIESLVLKKCKLVIFCSQEMRKHYEKKYQLKFDKYFVMPCFNENEVDQRAFENSEKYEKNNYVYIGGLQPWQCFGETLQVYKKIEENSANPVNLYVYTAEIETAKKEIQKAKIKNFHIEYKVKEELGECLNKIKYGFVLRANVEVNRVATPTKLSNYISHGIIPIYSDCLKSFDQYNKDSNGPALVCNVEDLESGMKEILRSSATKPDANKIKDWCERTYNTYYGQDAYVLELEKLIRII